MADNALLVKWDKPAFIAFQKIYDHIRKDSPVNAEKVKQEILAITKGLADYPERYPPDKFKTNNTGNYRAFEKYSYRVAYVYNGSEIRILRIRHVRQEPLRY